MRQLVDAATAKSRCQWEHTSHVLAALYNANRGSGQSALSADDLNPFKAKKRRRRAKRQRVEALHAKHDALVAAGHVESLPPQKVIE